MALLGAVGPFDPAVDDWVVYCERLEQFFQANGVATAEKQRAVLLSVCGSPTYLLIRNLVSPDKPTDKTYVQLVKMVREHVSPPPPVSVQRFHFNSRIQKDAETVAQFVTELKRLSEYCSFGETLDDMLRDRLVCGVRDSRLQRRLLTEKDLTFAKAFELAKLAELAERSAGEIQPPVGDPEPVHVVQAPQPRANQDACYRCGGRHKASECWCRNVECYHCGKQGHLARVCRAKRGDYKEPTQGRGRQRRPQRTQQQPELDSGQKDTYTLFPVQDPSRKPVTLRVLLNDSPLEMEVDTGAAASVISEKTYWALWPKQRRPLLQDTSILLRTYTGEQLKVKGQVSVAVCYGGTTMSLNLLVVAGSGPSLMGRDWLYKLKPNLGIFHTSIHVGMDNHIQKLLSRHSELFKDELGLVKGVTVKLYVDPSATPRFFRPRSVPHALRGRVEQELERLEKTGIIEAIKFSDWATPVVPLVKGDGSIRICGDYKVTINRVANVESYPLPRIDDLLAGLEKGKVFSKLDLAHAYLQLQLDEESRKLATISTHKGLFCYNRLPFGVFSAPAIFQRTMEGILKGIPYVHAYLDDILVTGTSESEHLQILEQVLTRLEEVGIRLKESKCQFLLPSVEYLGYRISGNGIQPTEEKLRAIRDAPTPRDLSQLKSFLGLLNYYGKFLPHLSSTLAPLYKMLSKGQVWHWGREQEKAFCIAKSQLTSDTLLVHFDPTLQLALSCDASPYGLGAVLSHVCEDGSDKPIAYASRSLAPAEKKYSQLEKEGLAIVFGVKKFHQYLCGRKFVVHSDHKPLQFLFKEDKPVPTMASARIQRWALTLSAYDYRIVFRAGKENSNADGLSRLPLRESPSSVPVPGDTVLMMEALSDMGSAVSATTIKSWTDRDPVLSRVRRMVLHGWQQQEGVDFQPYEQRKHELSVEDGCVLWGSRVVVPSAGREAVVRLLHEGHPGISRMKALARGVVWWPGLDSQLESKVKECVACQSSRKSPPKAPLHPWEWPTKPWVRLHVDFAGPFLGKTLMVIVDAHSKWLEASIVSSPSAEQAIRVLRHVFSTHGLPEVLVSDNGSAFTSAQFQTFVKLNGFRHVKSAPYHPASNGLAERAVQTVKEALKKTTGDLETRLARFLFQYRLTPHSTTGQPPAELLMGRRPRSHLDFLFPSVAQRVQQSQERQKTNHDQHVQSRTFQVGDEVYVVNHRGSPKWLPGVVVKLLGPLNLIVKVKGGQEARYHSDHVRARTGGEKGINNDDSDIEDDDDDPLPPVLDTLPVPALPPGEVDQEQMVPMDAMEPPPPAPVLRRSTRHHRPPDRF